MADCHVVIRGRVQGVGFRWFVRVHARRLGLAGFARNLPDGTVMVRASGPAEAIEDLLAQLKVGPEGAEVSSIDPVAAQVDQAILPTPFAIEK